MNGRNPIFTFEIAFNYLDIPIPKFIISVKYVRVKFSGDSTYMYPTFGYMSLYTKVRGLGSSAPRHTPT